MNPIDLRTYALYSSKIPPKFLFEIKNPSQDIPLWRILAALGLDFYVASFLVLSIVFSYQLAIAQFMLTSPLKASFYKIPFTLPVLGSAPLILFSYFFFCFFFNQGQSFGMWRFRNRVSMSSQNFGTSLKWALFSAGMILTLGLIYPILKNEQKNGIRAHDYLYQGLITQTSFEQVDIFDLMSKQEVPSLYEEIKTAA